MDRHRGVDVDVGALPAAMDDAMDVTSKNKAGGRSSAGFAAVLTARRVGPHSTDCHPAPTDDGLNAAADVSVAVEPSFTRIAKSHAPARHAWRRLRRHRVITEALLIR